MPRLVLRPHKPTRSFASFAARLCRTPKRSSTYHQYACVPFSRAPRLATKSTSFGIRPYEVGALVIYSIFAIFFWIKASFAYSLPPCEELIFETGEPSATFSQYYDRLQRNRCEKPWLILIYMAADNDLSPYGYRDIWEMERVGSHSSFDVLVYLDDETMEGTRYYYIGKNNGIGKTQVQDYREYLSEIDSFSKGQSFKDDSAREEAYLRAHGKSLVTSPAVVIKGEENSASYFSAGKFLTWALNRFPSQHLMLIGWGHGKGFDAPTFLRNGEYRQGGFAFDFTSNSHMSVTEVAKKIGPLLKKYREKEVIDILGSDSCLNQQIEFGFEWKGLSHFLFGSSSYVQKKGMDYKNLLNFIKNNSSESPYEIAKKIPKIYQSSVSGYPGYGGYKDPLATFSTLSVSELTLLKKSFEGLGLALTNWICLGSKLSTKLERRKMILDEVLFKTIRFGGISNDILNFLQIIEIWLLDLDEDKMDHGSLHLIKSALSSTRENLNRSVLSWYIGPGYQSDLGGDIGSRGVSIWLPASRDEYLKRLPQFETSQFYKGDLGLNSWAKFVRILYEDKKKICR